MTRRRVAGAGGQHAQPLAQALPQPLNAQRGHPRRRHLQRQRNAVQAAANLGHGGAVLRPQLETPVRRLHPANEQVYRAELRQFLHPRRRAGRQGQRIQPVGDLTLDPQRLLAGCQHRNRLATRQQCRHQRRHAVQQMLAIIE